ncbi:MAG: InlB B-repeat-containing protein [Spirochaetales bacterium]|nr:InlB B-repeat-containing protein [Spirochaetales bacterium]
MRNRLLILLLVVLVAAALVSCNQETESKTFTVTFKANDEAATGEMAPQKVERYVNESLAANKFVKEGWIFRSWNTKADGTGTAYFDKATVRLAKDITLYAQWEYNQVSVTFNANGGTGEMPAQNVNKRTDTPLNANTFTLVDCAFTGWNTKSDGTGTAHGDKSVIKISQDITLYAQWHHHEAIITFDKNGGDGTMAAQIVQINTPTALTANTFTKESHVFVGWNSEAAGTGASYANKAEINIADNLTLYAQWLPSKIVTFNANGGSGEMESQIVPAETPTMLKANAFTNGDLIFAGWNTEAEGSGTAYDDKAQVSLSDDLTLFAQWTDAIIIDESTTELGTGRYTIDKNVTIDSRITVSGDAVIVLPDGFTLTASNGISVNNGFALRIETSGTGTGSLDATGADGNAAIGGDSGSDSGSIVITGGSITAISAEGGAAGIGGGASGTAGAISISGGTVNAVAGGGAFAIGRGAESTGVSAITISDTLSLLSNFEPVIPASSYTDAGDAPTPAHMVMISPGT